MEHRIPYNTEGETLKMPEYGRWVMQMIEQIKILPTKEKRTAGAKQVWAVMERLNPESKGTDGHEQKLWDHLAYLAGYDLDIDWPVQIRRVDEVGTIEKLNYPGNEIQFLHYGNLMEKWLGQIVNVPQGVQRETMVMQAAWRMKKNLAEWRGDGGEVNEKVARDVEMYTKGEVKADEVMALLEKKQKQGKGSRRK